MSEVRLKQTKAFRLYRYTHLDGSAKEWAVRDNGDGTFTVRWGKADHLVQSKTRAQKFPGEVDDLIRRKLAKGYEYVGEFLFGDADTAPRQVAPAKPAREAGVYWEIRVRSGGIALSQALAEIGQALMFKGVAANVPDGQGGISFRVGNWDFPSPERKSGVLYPENGPLPLLVLLALKKREIPGVSVSIADEEGVEIGTRLRAEKKALAFLGTTFEEIRELAEMLGIMKKRLELDKIEAPEPNLYF